MDPVLFDSAAGACLNPVHWLVVPTQLLDMKIFVDTDSDIRLVRRLRRDISERGRDIEGVIKQYNKFVKPAFDQYIQPTMRLADIVVPRGEPASLVFLPVRQEGQQASELSSLSPPPGSGNTVAIDLIVQHVHSQLEEVSQSDNTQSPYLSAVPPHPTAACTLHPTLHCPVQVLTLKCSEPAS